jgi:cellulose synthase/poly-beta-1,6-N-acetylglucosamine synthase-like glycosyltransferase
LVTIQLPIYNEKYVVERLLTSIAALEYPREKLEIQVLDDSTDDSVIDTANLILKLANTGLDIKHITRSNRHGFKAGALKEGLVHAKGEFIVILMLILYLKKIGYYKLSLISKIQNWSSTNPLGHLNRNYSVLTKIQAFALDAHFTLEQVGRNSKAHFINFNGTAGFEKNLHSRCWKLGK